MTNTTVPSRVSATPAAIALIERLKRENGEIMFHQSGGCCEGSAPLCLLQGELQTGPNDVMLGEIAGVPFYMGRAQFAFWEHTHLIIDAVPGGGSNAFSLDARPAGLSSRNPACTATTSGPSSPPCRRCNEDSRAVRTIGAFFLFVASKKQQEKLHARLSRPHHTGRFACQAFRPGVRIG